MCKSLYFYASAHFGHKMHIAIYYMCMLDIYHILRESVRKHKSIMTYTYLWILIPFCFSCAYTQAHTLSLCLVYIQILTHMHIHKKHIHQYVILYTLDVQNIWKILMVIITHTCGFEVSSALRIHTLRFFASYIYTSTYIRM